MTPADTTDFVVLAAELTDRITCTKTDVYGDQVNVVELSAIEDRILVLRHTETGALRVVTFGPYYANGHFADERGPDELVGEIVDPSEALSRRGGVVTYLDPALVAEAIAQLLEADAADEYDYYDEPRLGSDALIEDERAKDDDEN